MPLASAISGGASALGAITNGILGWFQAEKDRDFNAEQAALNRDYQTSERLATQQFDLDMWNLNNDYNDIGSQMARARAAGVNPAALLGGQYKSAQATAPTSTPMQGSAASSSSGGAVGSALINSTAPLLQSATGAVKNLVDANVAQGLLPYNQDLLRAQTLHNLADLQLIASKAGVEDATRENIQKATAWMDGLNAVAIQERLSNINKLYVEQFEIIQQIRESRSRVKLNEATTEGIKLENEFNTQHYQNVLTAEELQNWELQFKKDFALALGRPLGTSEFEFNYSLLLEGQFDSFCRGVLTPAAQATWTPEQFKLIEENGMQVAGVNIWGNKRTSMLHGGFAPQSGIYNPANMFNSDFIMPRSIFFTPNEVTPYQKFKKKYGIK